MKVTPVLIIWRSVVWTWATRSKGVLIKVERGEQVHEERLHRASKKQHTQRPF